MNYGENTLFSWHSSDVPNKDLFVSVLEYCYRLVFV